MSTDPMAPDPDPQADATREAFNQAAGTPPDQSVEIAPSAAPITPGAPDDAPGHAPPSHSFAHEAMPDERNGGLTHDFNEVARDGGQPQHDEGTKIEQPGTPALDLRPPPEYRLSPELEAMNARENAKLAIHRADEVGLKKDRGLDLGL